MTAADLDHDEEIALRGVYLSRLMFGWMLPPDLAYVETRSYEEFLAAACPPERGEE